MIASPLLSSLVAGPMEHLEHSEAGHHDDVLGDVELTTIVVIVLVLIMFTVAFEEAKEYVEHRVPDELISVFEKLFGELTILGFLSIITFICQETNV